MMEALYSQEEIDELRESEAEKRGAAKSFWSLVQEKIITKAMAARKLGVSVAEFDKMCKEFAFVK